MPPTQSEVPCRVRPKIKITPVLAHLGLLQTRSGTVQARTAPRKPVSIPTNVIVPTLPKRPSSWNDFPSDMLLEVASYLLDDRLALLNLTHLCSYWRRVVIECPLNWTYVSSKYPLKLFSLWLQRSKDVPINADICSLPPGLYGGSMITSVNGLS